MTGKSVFAKLVVATIASSTVALPVCAGGDKVAFPENWASGVMYMSLNRPVNPRPAVAGVENSAQYREYYVTPPAIEALRKGEPVPSGTVIVNVMYRAQLDAQGNPLRDANGHFIKGKLIGFGVMEKRADWGAEYPPEVCNGDWEYQVFGADRKPNDKVGLATCFRCHKSRADNDFLFTMDRLKAAAAK